MKAFEANIRKVIPYTPGEQPKDKVIKLNTNENPYPPSPKVMEALKNIDADKLKLYPDPAVTKLIKAVAGTHGVDEEKVFIGVGSDDILAMCYLTFFNGNKPISFPDITYSFYPVWAELFNVPYERESVDEDFRIKKEDYYKENGGVIIPNPNAPTGIYEDISVIEDIVAANKDVVVIIDEAYIDFAGASSISLTDRYDNLLVVRTFSKSRSLAGMRIGYAIGSPLLIKYLNDVKYSFNSYTMSVPAIECGVASLIDIKYFEECREKIIRTREAARIRLGELGFKVLESGANFVFASHPSYSACEIFMKLKAKGIYVRYWNQPRIDEYLRISIGTDSEMEVLYEALMEICR